MGTTHTTGVDYTLEALNLMSTFLFCGEFMLLPYITSVLLWCAHFYLVIRFVTHICFAAFNWLLYLQKDYVCLSSISMTNVVHGAADFTSNL